MYLGRFQLGQFVPLFVACRTNGATEVAPTAAPTVSIYKANDTPVLDAKSLAPYIKGQLTGHFRGEVFLNGSYSAGRYHGIYSWASGGSTYRQEFSFEVVAGGHTSGEYIGLRFYQRPHADYLIGLTDGGTLEFRRNPRPA